MTIKEWLGEDNQLGIDIWEKKYRHNNETFDEWLNRVSGGNEELRLLIKEKKFLFGGRILSNRGMDKKGEKVIAGKSAKLLYPFKDKAQKLKERPMLKPATDKIVPKMGEFYVDEAEKRLAKEMSKKLKS